MENDNSAVRTAVKAHRRRLSAGRQFALLVRLAELLPEMGKIWEA